MRGTHMAQFDTENTSHGSRHIYESGRRRWREHRRQTPKMVRVDELQPRRFAARVRGQRDRGPDRGPCRFSRPQCGQDHRQRHAGFEYPLRHRQAHPQDRGGGVSCHGRKALLHEVHAGRLYRDLDLRRWFSGG